MPVVRDLISTVNRLTQPGSAAGGVEPATTDVAPAPDPEGRTDAGIEPSLDDLLEDPVVQLVMRADAIDPADIRRLFRAPCQGAPRSAGSAPPTATRAR